jgi:hypothetical protein
MGSLPKAGISVANGDRARARFRRDSYPKCYPRLGKMLQVPLDSHFGRKSTPAVGERPHTVREGVAAARAWTSSKSDVSAAAGCCACRRQWIWGSQSPSTSERTRPVAWAHAGRTGPTDGDGFARTNWRSPTFEMMRALVSDSCTAVLDFQRGESYQQFRAEGYVLALAVAIETSWDAVQSHCMVCGGTAANALRLCSRRRNDLIAEPDSRAAFESCSPSPLTTICV